MLPNPYPDLSSDGKVQESDLAHFLGDLRKNEKNSETKPPLPAAKIPDMPLKNREKKPTALK